MGGVLSSPNATTTVLKIDFFSVLSSMSACASSSSSPFPRSIIFFCVFFFLFKIFLNKILPLCTFFLFFSFFFYILPFALFLLILHLRLNLFNRPSISLLSIQNKQLFCSSLY